MINEKGHASTTETKHFLNKGNYAVCLLGLQESSKTTKACKSDDLQAY